MFGSLIYLTIREGTD